MAAHAASPTARPAVAACARSHTPVACAAPCAAARDPRRQEARGYHTAHLSVAAARPRRRCRVFCVPHAYDTSTTSPVLVTREAGKNGPLVKRLASAGIQCVEVPLIEHGTGPDRARLPEALRQPWDWVLLTSPEAASVFLEAWQLAGRPTIRIATVGGGTSAVLSGHCPVAFTPSKADGHTLAAELPLDGITRSGGVLYPCSCRASTELQDGLAARSCAVTRMNTYDTVPASSLPPDARQLAAQAAVVTFASPSAIKAYVKLLLPSPPLTAGCEHPHPPVACIGHTSAAAAVRAGLRRVHYPDSPGVEGWALAVQAALRGDAPRDRELLEAAQAGGKPQDNDG